MMLLRNSRIGGSIAGARWQSMRWESYDRVAGHSVSPNPTNYLLRKSRIGGTIVKWQGCVDTENAEVSNDEKDSHMTLIEIGAWMEIATEGAHKN